jgi:UDP-N-acetylglucosamine 2-epimerase (non-hydrolysing)
MKVAPVIEAVEHLSKTGSGNRNVHQLLVHTGQHYDHAMSTLFFEELGLPRPDINLEVGSASHGTQTGRIMEAFEKVLLHERPDIVIVVGDVNSTMACTIDAKKLGITVAHIEAGLRSRDLTMPEEINRMVTDSISDLLFTTERGANQNLLNEGRPESCIHFTGNVMIDTLLKHRDAAMRLPTLEKLGLKAQGDRPRGYAVLTLHRPSNVDNDSIMKKIGQVLQHIGKQFPIIFPVHPRTRTKIADFNLSDVFSERHGIRMIDPLGYLDFLNLMANARVVLTDSGGIQEETTILGVPCLTLRHNTERPITVEQGTNLLVGNEPEAILAGFNQILEGKAGMLKQTPELWDGKAAVRIAGVLLNRNIPAQ